MLTIKSYENERFEIDAVVGIQSGKIKPRVMAGYNTIPLRDVKSTILAKVIDYLNMHVDDDNGTKMTLEDEESLKRFDEEFVNVEHRVLYDLILAASYMDIPKLLDLASQAMSDMLKDKSLEEIRVILNIPNEFTPEEECHLYWDNQSVFEN